MLHDSARRLSERVELIEAFQLEIEEFAQQFLDQIETVARRDCRSAFERGLLSFSNHDLKEAVSLRGNVPRRVGVNRRFVDRHEYPVFGVQMSGRAGTRQRG